MGGSSTAVNHGSLLGCRVAGAANYIPAHIKTGVTKITRQMATFTVYQNIKEKTSKFRITAFGKMADIIAKSAAPGKELNLFCKMHSYSGRVFIGNDANGRANYVLGTDGQELKIDKVGFVIEDISFGADSDKLIQSEIQSGQRPPMWNIAGHPDNAAWKEICGQRNALKFVAGSTQFGYARVITPNGAIVDPDIANNVAGGGFQGVQTQAATGTGQYVQAPAGFQGVQAPVAPGNTGTGQYVQAPVAPGAPVMVNGQNMGYAPVQGNPAVVPQQAYAAQNQVAPANVGFAM